MLEETEESTSKMIMNNNPNWISIRVLMGDKDLTQRCFGTGISIC